MHRSTPDGTGKIPIVDLPRADFCYATFQMFLQLAPTCEAEQQRKQKDNPDNQLPIANML